MIKLVLDSSTDYYYIALLNDMDIIKERYEYSKQSSSESLMVDLENILKESNLTLKEVEDIYVGIGPGSYTGIRVAVTIAKMLWALSNARLYSFSTLSLIASSKELESYPLIDARRGNAYISHFTIKDGILTKLEDDKVVSIDEYFKDKEEDRNLIVENGMPNIKLLLNSSLLTEVKDGDALTPNYLQLVEAERKRRGLEWIL